MPEPERPQSARTRAGPGGRTAAGAGPSPPAGDGDAGDGGDPPDGEPTGGPSGVVRRVGAVALDFVRHAGRAGLLLVAVIGGLRRPSRYARATLVQAKRIGVDSVLLVVLIGALGGSILAQQSGYQFTMLPAALVVGEAVAAGMLTELGPVLTALVLAGRVGAGIGAQLGTMKVTEQIDALVTVGRDPVVEYVIPRVLAGVVVLVPLVILANAAGLVSGWITAVALLPMETADYVRSMRQYFHGTAVLFSLTKAAVFGFTLTFLASYVGLQASEGARGVGRTTTRAVVTIIVAVMALDVVLAPLYKAMK